MQTDVIHTVFLPPISREGDQSCNMSAQEVMLTWNGHHRTLISVFEKLLENNTLVDCSIAVEGHKLKAHKEVLSAFSPYFELLFREENEKNPTIILSGFSLEDLQCIIDFMYHGKVTINEDKVEELMVTAQCLQIKGLGGGQKDNDSSNQKEHYREREAGSSYGPHKRKRRMSDEESESALFPECNVNIESHSYRSSGPHLKSANLVPLPPSQRTSPSQSITPNSNLDKSYGHNEVRPASNYTSLPVQPSLSSPDGEEHILDPALIVKTELGPDHKTNLAKNSCMVLPRVKREDSLEITSCQSKRSSCNRGGEELAPGLSSNLDVRNDNAYEYITPSVLPQNHFISVKTEPQAEEEVFLSEDETYSGGRKGASLASTHGAAMQRAYGQIPSRGTSGVDWVPEGSSSLPSSAPLEMRDMGRRQQARRAPREYTCPECHKIFRQSCNLKVHMRTHTGERPYKCTECDFAATHISNLKQHQRIHSGERPFKCSECNFAAAGSGDLKKHQRIHSGEKPYRCTECDFAATGSGDLHKHLRIHGKDMPGKSEFDCSVPGTSDLIHSIPKYFENNYLLKMSNL